MAKRKTVEVATFRNYVNDALKNSLGPPEYREGMIVVLEEMLHSTGNYRGFTYLSALCMDPKGKYPTIQPGIRWTAGFEPSFVDCDKTRRYYL